MTLNLNDSVSVQQADAKDFLAQADKPFDMIFLDAERQFYMDYAADLVRLLDFGSALIVDNVISHAAEVADFLAYFEQDNSLLCTTLPIGAGLFMAVKQVA
jgi:predicted O-methyltransferase YrrM